MIRSSMHVRPSGQVDGAAVNNSVDAFERSANTPPSTVNPPPFDQVGFAWASTPADVQRTIVGTMLANIGVLSFDAEYLGAVIAEMNRRMALAHQHPTYLMMSMTCAEWSAKNPAQKLIKVGDYFILNNVSYLYVRPVDYPTIAASLDSACPTAPPPAETPPPPAPAETPPPPPSPPPAPLRSVLRVTVSSSDPLPGDLSVMLGANPMHMVDTGVYEIDLPAGTSSVVVTGTGVTRQEQSVTAIPGITTVAAIRLVSTAPPPPPPREEAPPPPPPPPASETPPPPPHDEAPPCPPPPQAWSTEQERTDWIRIHATCPPPGPWCPPLPASFGSEAARQAWINLHASCPLPAPWVAPVAPPAPVVVAVVEKKSSFWKWVGGLAVVSGVGYAYNKQREAKKKAGLR